MHCATGDGAQARAGSLHRFVVLRLVGLPLRVGVLEQFVVVVDHLRFGNCIGGLVNVRVWVFYRGGEGRSLGSCLCFTLGTQLGGPLGLADILYRLPLLRLFAGAAPGEEATRLLFLLFFRCVIRRHVAILRHLLAVVGG